MAFKKLRSTQRATHSAAGGHVRNSPTGHDPHRAGATPQLLKDYPSADNDPLHFGPREGRETYRLTNTTIERTRTTASKLSRRFTKFIQNMHGQVKIPHDLIGGGNDSVKTLDVGQIPED